MSHFHTPNYDISVTVCFVYHYTDILESLILRCISGEVTDHFARMFWIEFRKLVRFRASYPFITHISFAFFYATDTFCQKESTSAVSVCQRVNSYQDDKEKKQKQPSFSSMTDFRNIP